MNSLQRQSLADKLKSLGVKTGARELAPPQTAPASSYAIDSVVAGAFHPTPRGDVFIAEQAYLPDYRHGNAPIVCALPLALI